MVAQPLPRFDTLTDEERAFLCTFPDDAERSPWMVGRDYHRLAIEALYHPLDHQGKLQSAVLGLSLAQDGMLLRLEDAAGRPLPTMDEEMEELDRLRAERARLRGEQP